MKIRDKESAVSSCSKTSPLLDQHRRMHVGVSGRQGPTRGLACQKGWWWWWYLKGCLVQYKGLGLWNPRDLVLNLNPTS